MNDCIWCGISVCESNNCRCKKYISMNSDEGYAISAKFEKIWDEKVKPLQDEIAKEFAKNNGFQEVTK